VLAALVLLPGLALLAGWEILCLGQVVLAERVRFLPRWAWAVACLIFIPLGGVLYLLVRPGVDARHEPLRGVTPGSRIVETLPTNTGGVGPSGRT